MRFPRNPVSTLRPFAARFTCPAPPEAKTQDPGLKAYKSWRDQIPGAQKAFVDWTPPAKAQAPGLRAYKSWLDQICRPGSNFVDFDVQPPIAEPALDADAGVQDLAKDRPQGERPAVGDDTQTDALPMPHSRALPSVQITAAYQPLAIYSPFNCCLIRVL